MSVCKKYTKKDSGITWDTAPEFLTEAQAAALTGFSLSFFRKARCRGLLKNSLPSPEFVRNGRRVYYPREILKAWCAKHKLHQFI